MHAVALVLGAWPASESCRLRQGDGDHERGNRCRRGLVLPSLLIDQRIKDLGDWRATMLSRGRTLIEHLDPEVVEETLSISMAPS